jgi:hypothetical protein
MIYLWEKPRSRYKAAARIAGVLALQVGAAYGHGNLAWRTA